jgi:hypothetical protein
VGISDGNLNIQYKHTDKYNINYHSGVFSLIDGAGNVINESFGIKSGDLTEQGFDISKIDDPTSLGLVFTGTRVQHIIEGTWHMKFVAEELLARKSLTVEPTDRTNFAQFEFIVSAIATEVNILSGKDFSREDFDNGNVSAYLDGASNYLNSFGTPYLTLKDGEIIELEHSGSGGIWIDNVGGQCNYDSSYFDINRLYSIIFCGEEYVF